MSRRAGFAQVRSTATKQSGPPDLSRRERQILDALYRAGRATVAEIREEIPRAPSYSAVRTLLKILEDKGHARHEDDGTRYVYMPIVERERARRSAMRHVLNTFFEGSATQAILTLLHEDSKRLSREDWDRLTEMIERAREDGI
jgi:BlaI family penicillinase repressor